MRGKAQRVDEVPEPGVETIAEVRGPVLFALMDELGQHADDLRFADAELLEKIVIPAKTENLRVITPQVYLS